MRRGNKTNIDSPIANFTQAAEPFLLQDFEQLALNLKIHIADLIEKHRAAVRDLEKSHFAVHRARKSAPLMTEQLRLEKLPRQSGAVEIDEGLFRPRTVVAQPSGKTPLPVPVSPKMRIGLSVKRTLLRLRRADGFPH